MNPILAAVCVAASALMLWAGPPKGTPVEPSSEERALFTAFAGKALGKMAWSSSRSGNHLIYVMNADGSDTRQLTQGNKTDWFSRFSPDGKRVAFTRSKMDWTSESNADNPAMWDTWIINTDGTGEKLVITNSTWATWRPDGTTLVFSRGGRVLTFALESGEEKLVLDADSTLKKGTILQNPHLSPHGRFLALTLRGGMRETGLYDLAAKQWTRVGEGCQINWFPSGDSVLRMNPTGNGGSEVLSFAVKQGRPMNPSVSNDQIRFMDLPGRRSHEYFPQVSPDGRWLVWCATQRGHDHDMADYEVYIWGIGSAPENAVRLTFHSGNDRWPDIWIEK